MVASRDDRMVQAPLGQSGPKGRGIGAVKLMRTRIGLLSQPKSMRSIIDATRREQRHGLA
jgi:hypothetical protein